MTRAQYAQIMFTLWLISANTFKWQEARILAFVMSVLWALVWWGVWWDAT